MASLARLVRETLTNKPISITRYLPLTIDQKS